MRLRSRHTAHPTGFPSPALARFLFHDPRSAPLWLAVRLYVGLAWLHAGLAKATGSPSWLHSGTPLKGFWTNAVTVSPSGKSAISYAWYRAFLHALLTHHSYTWFAKLICLGELLVGVGLIVGGLTGIAAGFGAMLNMSYMLAGAASTNPVLFGLAILLVLAWRVAGAWGVDRVALPLLGTPWRPGTLLSPEHATDGTEQRGLPEAGTRASARRTAHALPETRA
jgi:thiosulfate dehydrogenase [quinone] large subunit